MSGTVVGAVAGAVLVTVIVALWIRLKGEKKRVRASEEAHEQTRAQLVTTANEAKEARRRYKNHVEALHEEVDRLRDEVDRCTDPAVLRDRINRLSEMSRFRQNP